MIRFQPTPTYQTVKQPPRCFRSLAERMADDMRELAFAGQNVSVETLGERGYPEEVVKRLGAKAIGIARRQSTRQIVEA
ncbi:Hypothetical protein NGAL_HAMBI1146_58410 [Neorhizobium galegae bv. officinalis]|nr:Hypothetical protein NGAL_HAMBI1146_58410 [Neorhizobium galegae bv. officinalis]